GRDRGAALHHRGLRGLAPAAATGPDLDPGLDAAAGPQLGPAAPPGLPGRGTGGAPFLVGGEVRRQRAAAVRGHPCSAAGLEAGVALAQRRGGAVGAPLNPRRTAIASPAARPARAPRPAARAGAWPRHRSAAGRRPPKPSLV